MSGSRYWEGPHDRHYAYSVEPSYECPVGKAAAQVVNVTGHVDQPIDEAASLLKMPVEALARCLRKSSCGGRHREGDRLTDRCTAHGCKMSKRGYRAYIDEPVPEGEDTSLGRLSSELSRALGGDGQRRRVVEQRWCLTKTEARTWAWEKCKAACEAASRAKVPS